MLVKKALSQDVIVLAFVPLLAHYGVSSMTLNPEELPSLHFQSSYIQDMRLNKMSSATFGEASFIIVYLKGGIFMKQVIRHENLNVRKGIVSN
ncbi:hypothetical protein ABH968_001316 [Lysinibacillus sp. RC79]